MRGLDGFMNVSLRVQGFRVVRSLATLVLRVPYLVLRVPYLVLRVP